MSKGKKKQPNKKAKPSVWVETGPARAAERAKRSTSEFFAINPRPIFSATIYADMPRSHAAPPVVPKHDLHYASIARVRRHYSAMTFAIRTPEMSEIALSLNESFLRLAALAYSPVFLVGMAGRFQEVFNRAVFAILGKPMIESPDDAERDPEIATLYQEMLIAEIPEMFNREDFEDYAANLDFLSQWEGSPIRNGLKAILGAQVSGIWTIFESAAKDAWISAVNIRPRQLGSKQDVLGEKTLPAALLQKFSFDLRWKMGTMLAGKFGFDSLDGSRDAYEAAFGKDSSLASVFRRRSIWIVNEIRNVLVHRGGLADEGFVQKMRNANRWSKIVAVEEIPLDGKIVAAMTWITVRSAMELITGVDDWLIAHPE